MSRVGDACVRELDAVVRVLRDEHELLGVDAHADGLGLVGEDFVVGRGVHDGVEAVGVGRGDRGAPERLGLSHAPGEELADHAHRDGVVVHANRVVELRVSGTGAGVEHELDAVAATLPVAALLVGVHVGQALAQFGRDVVERSGGVLLVGAELLLLLVERSVAVVAEVGVVEHAHHAQQTRVVAREVLVVRVHGRGVGVAWVQLGHGDAGGIAERALDVALDLDRAEEAGSLELAPGGLLLRRGQGEHLLGEVRVPVGEDVGFAGLGVENGTLRDGFHALVDEAQGAYRLVLVLGLAVEAFGLVQDGLGRAVGGHVGVEERLVVLGAVDAALGDDGVAGRRLALGVVVAHAGADAGSLGDARVLAVAVDVGGASVEVTSTDLSVMDAHGIELGLSLLIGLGGRVELVEDLSLEEVHCVFEHVRALDGEVSLLGCRLVGVVKAGVLAVLQRAPAVRTEHRRDDLLRGRVDAQAVAAYVGMRPLDVGEAAGGIGVDLGRRVVLVDVDRLGILVEDHRLVVEGRLVVAVLEEVLEVDDVRGVVGDEACDGVCGLVDGRVLRDLGVLEDLASYDAKLALEADSALLLVQTCHVEVSSALEPELADEVRQRGEVRLRLLDALGRAQGKRQLTQLGQGVAERLRHLAHELRREEDVVEGAQGLRVDVRGVDDEPADRHLVVGRLRGERALGRGERADALVQLTHALTVLWRGVVALLGERVDLTGETRRVGEQARVHVPVDGVEHAHRVGVGRVRRRALVLLEVGAGDGGEVEGEHRRVVVVRVVAEQVRVAVPPVCVHVEGKLGLAIVGTRVAHAAPRVVEADNRARLPLDV